MRKIIKKIRRRLIFWRVRQYLKYSQEEHNYTHIDQALEMDSDKEIGSMVNKVYFH